MPMSTSLKQKWKCPGVSTASFIFCCLWWSLELPFAVMNYVLGCLECCCNDHQMQKIWAVSGKGCHGSHNPPCWHKIQDYFRGNWTAIIRNDYYYWGKQNRSLYQGLCYVTRFHCTAELYGNIIVWEYNNLVWSSTEQKNIWFSLIWD